MRKTKSVTPSPPKIAAIYRYISFGAGSLTEEVETLYNYLAQLPGSPENNSGSGEAAPRKQGVNENMAEPWGIGVAVSRGGGGICAAAAASNVGAPLGWDSWMAVRILAWLSLRDFH